MTHYTPFDQEEKLGPFPWDTLDEKVALWERAHGHDVRLKCSPESRCLVLEDASWERGYERGYMDAVRDMSRQGGGPRLTPGERSGRS